MHKIRSLSLLLFVVATSCLAAAKSYVTESFSGGIPSSYTLVNANQSLLKSGIYSNIGNDPMVAWVAGEISKANGRAALAPTHNSDASTASDRWMILPAIHIDDDLAVLRWQARSMHRQRPESYRVAARVAGSESWSDIFICDSENHHLTTHCIPIGQYLGNDIEIAFVANTTDGFILAVDNIFIGVPDDDAFAFESVTKHYVAADQPLKISGTLYYYSTESRWSSAVLSFGDQSISMPLPSLTAGQSIDIEFEVAPELNTTTNYNISLIDNDGVATLAYSDFVCASHYSRLQIVDHCTGTWCNNCPLIDLTTSRLQRLYADDLLFVEVHVNDILTNNAYWSDYASEYVFAIPALIPNHQPAKLTYSINSTDNFSSALASTTTAKIEASATFDANNDIRVSSQVTFANDTDNSADNLRVAIMLIGDIHDPDNPLLTQQLSAMVYSYEEFYYMPSYIQPEMMRYENAIVDGTVAYNGIPASLPAILQANQPQTHSFSLPMPNVNGLDNLRAVAMVIDTSTHEILNASIATVDAPQGISSTTRDSSLQPIFYDIEGRPTTHPSKGFYIEMRDGKVSKTFKH